MPQARHQRADTYYRWKSKFGDVDVNDARRLRALEDENWRLKALGADLTLDAADPREAKSTWQVAALRTIRAGSAHGFTLAIAHQAPATGRELLDLIRG